MLGVISICVKYKKWLSKYLLPKMDSVHCTLVKYITATGVAWVFHQFTWRQVAARLERRAHAHVLLRSSVRCCRVDPESGAWFSVQYLDRTEAGARHICKAEEMEDNENETEKRDKNSPKSDRVTLKKEIGLLSACAIIIGECVTAFVCSGAVGAERGGHSEGHSEGQVNGGRVCPRGKSYCNVADVQLLLCSGSYNVLAQNKSSSAGFRFSSGPELLFGHRVDVPAVSRCSLWMIRGIMALKPPKYAPRVDFTHGCSSSDVWIQSGLLAAVHIWKRLHHSVIFWKWACLRGWVFLRPAWNAKSRSSVWFCARAELTLELYQG